VALVAPDWSCALVRNHDEKTKDMSRSVLPSTGREFARDLRRATHKRHRARELAAVTAYRRDADPESVTLDILGTHARDITHLVWERRGMDKVGPLIRWAHATIAADQALRAASPEEQVAHFARLMPPTLIGRHAVMHSEVALEWSALRGQDDASHRGAPGRGQQVAEAERQVRLILASGLHGALNTELRRLAGRQVAQPGVTPVPHRMLLGSHDVKPFVAETAPWPAVGALIAAVAARA
jgi:hypothetical protein